MRRRSWTPQVVAGVLVTLAIGAHASARPAVERVSVNARGVQGNGHSYAPLIADDGRFVAFLSQASNLVAGDDLEVSDLFIADRRRRTVRRVARRVIGIGFRNPFYFDGRVVGFIASGDTFPIVLRDVRSRVDVRVTVAADGRIVQGNYDGRLGVSHGARHVAFTAFEDGVVAGDDNGALDVFVRDVAARTTTRVSVASNGAQADAPSESPSISADGRFVAFQSQASNLVRGDTNGVPDVFVHDRRSGVTRRVSVRSDGGQVDAPLGQGSIAPSISRDGRLVAFASDAADLVPRDTNAATDVFVHDRRSRATRRVSVTSRGGQANGESFSPVLLGPSRTVLFATNATNLFRGDANNRFDHVLHDLRTGNTIPAAAGRVRPGRPSEHPTTHPMEFSADGRWATFSTGNDRYVRPDTNASEDVFVYGPFRRPWQISGARR